jgi:ethanolamine ammonia-lyase small subunit
MSRPDVPAGWRRLAALTPARVALGHSGAALPTAAVMRLALDHARARDAVHVPLDSARVRAAIEALGWPVLEADSAAPDRATYLRRPDLGRRLADNSRAALAAAAPAPADLCLMVGDGLSSTAVHAQAPALLAALQPLLAAVGWNLAPVVIARQARVALGDEVAVLLRARLVAVLIGERPGLSAPDSLGVYLTWDPRPGRTDAERNCLSNIRDGGLSHAEAARKLVWLAGEAMRRGLTGVALKDESDLMLAGAGTAAPTALS